MLLLLLGCAPDVECVTGPCDALLICAEEVGPRGELQYWVEGPDAVRWDCDGWDCTEALAWAECQVCGCAT